MPLSKRDYSFTGFGADRIDEDHKSTGNRHARFEGTSGKAAAYRKLPQNRWMRRPASSSAVVAVA